MIFLTRCKFIVYVENNYGAYFEGAEIIINLLQASHLHDALHLQAFLASLIHLDTTERVKLSFVHYQA